MLMKQVHCGGGKLLQGRQRSSASGGEQRSRGPVIAPNSLQIAPSFSGKPEGPGHPRAWVLSQQGGGLGCRTVIEQRESHGTSLYIELSACSS